MHELSLVRSSVACRVQVYRTLGTVQSPVSVALWLTDYGIVCLSDKAKALQHIQGSRPTVPRYALGRTGRSNERMSAVLQLHHPYAYVTGSLSQVASDHPAWLISAMQPVLQTAHVLDMQTLSL